jgi:hypothetical protein
MEVRCWYPVAEDHLVFGREALAGNQAVVVEVLILVLKVQLEFLVFHLAAEQNPTKGNSSTLVRHSALAPEHLVTTQVQHRSASDRLVALRLAVFERRSYIGS